MLYSSVLRQACTAAIGCSLLAKGRTTAVCYRLFLAVLVFLLAIGERREVRRCPCFSSYVCVSARYICIYSVLRMYLGISSWSTFIKFDGDIAISANFVFPARAYVRATEKSHVCRGTRCLLAFLVCLHITSQCIRWLDVRPPFSLIYSCTPPPPPPFTHAHAHAHTHFRCTCTHSPHAISVLYHVIVSFVFASPRPVPLFGSSSSSNKFACIRAWCTMEVPAEAIAELFESSERVKEYNK